MVCKLLYVPSLGVLLMLCSCTPSEYGSVDGVLCPPCPDVFSGFETCAFYEVDDVWAREGMLVDHSQYAGIGTPIRLSGLMHHKFCFNDTHVVFGSANPTVFGLLVSDNLIVKVHSPTLAQNFASEYAYLLGDDTGEHTRQFFFNDQPVEHVFCPRHGCEDMLLSYIRAAEKEIVFLTFAFTSRPVGEALIAAHQRGVRVRGVFDNLGAGSQFSQFHPLTKAGLEVYRVRPERGVMHHKVFLVDDIVIIGSFNPSQNANTRNAETLVALQDEMLASLVHSEFFRLTR